VRESGRCRVKYSRYCRANQQDDMYQGYTGLQEGGTCVWAPLTAKRSVYWPFRSVCDRKARPV